MASTQNKNTPNDYCLEQRQFALGGKYTTYEYSQYGHAYNPAMPCVGIIPTNLSRDVYSKNYIDISNHPFYTCNVNWNLVPLSLSERDSIKKCYPKFLAKTIVKLNND